MTTSVITVQTLLRSLARAGKINRNPERFLNLNDSDPIPGLFVSDKVAIYSELAEILRELAGKDPKLMMPYQQLIATLDQLRKDLSFD